LGEEMYRYKWGVPDQVVDQKGLAKRLSSMKIEQIAVDGRS